MIRIRYRDFSAGTHNAGGLHGVTRRGPRGVTVYLVPGLTAGERRAVLRRLRQEASRGFGPPLPRLGLARALCADRARTAAGTAAAAIRLHPAVTLLPGAFVAAMVTLFVLAAAGGSVDFTPGSGAARMADGLAPSPDGGPGQSGGRAQALPVYELFAVDYLGTAHPDDGGKPLGLGSQAAGKHAHGRDARVRVQECGVLPGCSAGERSAGAPRCRRDRPLAGAAGLGAVKGGVRLGHQHG